MIPSWVLLVLLVAVVLIPCAVAVIRRRRQVPWVAIEFDEGEVALLIDVLWHLAVYRGVSWPADDPRVDRSADLALRIAGEVGAEITISAAGPAGPVVKT